MSTKTVTQSFDVNALDKLITDLKNTRIVYNGEEEAALCSSVLFSWFGIIGGPAGVCVTAGLLTTALGVYFDTVQNTITSAIEKSENYKDFLQNHANNNLIKMEITLEEKTVNNKKYLIPIKFNVVAVHSLNPSGWILF